MAVEITFLRHGETTSNSSGVWQGHSNSPFTPSGHEQVKRAGERLGREHFDLVVSSDLGRAMDTASAVGQDFETNVEWREMDLGTWEGLTQDEIEQTAPDIAAALRAGEDVSVGGGERLSELVARMTTALDRLVDRLDDDDRALVVGHGGSLLALLTAVMGPSNHRRLVRLGNTSVSRIQVDQWGTRVSVYNDTTHLPGAPIRVDAEAAEIVLVRHGQTTANLEGRWQGHQDGALTEEGRSQARRLADTFPEVDAIYTSPLSRAADTAAEIGASQSRAVTPVEGLREIGFGSWEGLTFEEIKEHDPEGIQSLFDGVDAPRGGDGETFAHVGERMEQSLHDLVGNDPAARIAAVSHGGSTRAYVARILGIDFTDRHRLALLSNSAMARVVYGDGGPSVASWNLTPHLDPA